MTFTCFFYLGSFGLLHRIPTQPEGRVPGSIPPELQEEEEEGSPSLSVERWPAEVPGLESAKELEVPGRDGPSLLGESWSHSRLEEDEEEKDDVDELCGCA